MKAYKNKNGHIQHRGRKGEFSTPNLECGVCLDCSAAIMREADYSDGMIKNIYPENCHSCGSKNLEI